MRDPRLAKNRDIPYWRNALIDWFSSSGASYPWRDTTDPYAILVSELMLQQTQISTVLEKNYFVNWMNRFPTALKLADSTEEEILKAWEGLGYYNRARNLQKTARFVVENYDGVFPDTYEDLLALPGVGPYTASAVMSFAYNKPATVVDGNVIRVLSRVFSYDSPVDTTEGKKQIQNWAEELSSPDHPRIYNSAIMELGQKICSKGAPRCLICPVVKYCDSANDPELATRLPVKSRKQKVTRKQEEVLLIIEDEKILLSQESGSRRKGLWKLPAVSPDLSRKKLTFFTRIEYPITRFVVEMTVYELTQSSDNLKNIPEGKWFSILKDLPPMGAPYRKVLDQIK